MAWADLGQWYAEERKDALAAEAYRVCLDAEQASPVAASIQGRNWR
jgi:hypothetical protein